MKRTKNKMALKSYLTFAIFAFSMLNKSFASYHCTDHRIHSVREILCTFSNGNTIEADYDFQCLNVLTTSERAFTLKDKNGNLLSKQLIPNDLKVAIGGMLMKTSSVCNSHSFVGIVSAASNDSTKFNQKMTNLIIGISENNEKINMAKDLTHSDNYSGGGLDEYYLHRRNVNKVTWDQKAVYSYTIDPVDGITTYLKFWNADSKAYKTFRNCYSPIEFSEGGWINCYNTYGKTYVKNTTGGVFSGLSQINLNDFTRINIIENNIHFVTELNYIDDYRKLAIVFDDKDSTYLPTLLTLDLKTLNYFTNSIAARSEQANLDSFYSDLTLDRLYLKNINGIKIVNRLSGNVNEFSKCLVNYDDLKPENSFYISSTMAENNADIDPVHPCWKNPNSR